MTEALVIPGLLSIDPELWDGVGPAEVTIGPLAGWAQRLDVTDWKTERWYLPREVAQRLGVSPPERRLDLSACPALAAALSAALLVRVDEAVAMTAIAAQAPALLVAYHRGAGGGGLTVHRGGEVRGFSGDSFSLARAASPGHEDDDDEGDEDDDDGPELDVNLLYDRLLRVISDGEWSLFDVDLAERAALLDPAELASYAQEQGEIAAHAEAHRDEGLAILAALESATADAVETPTGRRFTRRQAPGFTLGGDADLQLIGGPIVVPPHTRWIAEDVAAFNPPERVARRSRLIAQNRPAAQPAPPTSAILLVVVAALLLLGWLLG